jgi:hypothetical protein
VKQRILKILQWKRKHLESTLKGYSLAVPSITSRTPKQKWNLNKVGPLGVGLSRIQKKHKSNCTRALQCHRCSTLEKQQKRPHGTAFSGTLSSLSPKSPSPQELLLSTTLLANLLFPWWLHSVSNRNQFSLPAVPKALLQLPCQHSDRNRRQGRTSRLGKRRGVCELLLSLANKLTAYILQWLLSLSHNPQGPIHVVSSPVQPHWLPLWSPNAKRPLSLMTIALPVFLTVKLFHKTPLDLILPFIHISAQISPDAWTSLWWQPTHSLYLTLLYFPPAH